MSFGTPDQRARLFGDALARHRIGNAGPERNRTSLADMTTRLAAIRLLDHRGASATGREDGLDRHRRDVRPLTLHDTPRGKHQAGGRSPLVVGDGARIARELESWMEEGEVDGFNLTHTVVPECGDDLVRIAVPARQERGLHKRRYRGGTLRAKLFGRGDRSGGAHAGAGARRPA